MKKMNNFMAIQNKITKTINTINKKTKRTYHVWKLHVHKLTEIIVKDIIPEIYQMYVIMDKSKDILTKEKDFTSNKIRELRKYYTIFCKDQMNTIDKEIIRPLWRSYNETFVDPFAKVNYSYSISVHKSQSSTYYNVFIDCEYILKNRNQLEAKRCMYTAITRAANEIHLLL